MILALRILLLAGAFGGIGLWLCWARLHPLYRWYAVVPITWLVHIALFHAARLLSLPLPVTFYNQWSIAIHLHALILLAAAPMVLWHTESEADD